MAFRDEQLATITKLGAKVKALDLQLEGLQAELTAKDGELTKLEHRLRDRPYQLHITKAVALLLVGMALGGGIWGLIHQVYSKRDAHSTQSVSSPEQLITVTRTLPLGSAGEGSPLFKSLLSPITTRALSQLGRDLLLEVSSCVKPNGQTVFAEVTFSGINGNVIDAAIGAEGGLLADSASLVDPEAQCVSELVSKMQLMPFRATTYKHRFEWLQQSR